jgi:xanthine/CO dehydrogenase XdhC/CoxF family maturation factor
MIDIADPILNFYQNTCQVRSSGTPFAIATVIEVIGSASARTGSKALFSNEGVNLIGWIGGGCAERFIGEEATLAIKEGKPRIVLADLDDEIFGLGVACGGKMRVFIDPIIPSETMNLPAAPLFESELRTLCGFYGWNIRTNKDSSPQTLEEFLLLLATTAAQQRRVSGENLRMVKGAPASYEPLPRFFAKAVTIVGQTRLTEALARHFTLLNYSIRVVGPTVIKENYPSSVKCHCLEKNYQEIEFHENEIVIIAGHTSQDPYLVEKAIKSGASHVAMVGSRKRSQEVLDHLKLTDQSITFPLFVPAGLDIEARNPDEIALSIVAELIQEMRNSP